MKACEFEGWIELEPQDIILKGDTWVTDVFGEPANDVVSGFRIGHKFEEQDVPRTYRLFRKSKGAKPARKRYTCKCQPLPLP